jgi:hypothetical protein
MIQTRLDQVQLDIVNALGLTSSNLSMVLNSSSCYLAYLFRKEDNLIAYHRREELLLEKEENTPYCLAPSRYLD